MVFGQVIGQKIVVLINQVLLTRYLSELDFGNYAIVVGATNITFMFGLFGLSEVLINRARALSHWIPHAYSLYVVLGILSGLLTVMVGGVLGLGSGDWVLLKLLILFGLSTVFMSINTFYEVLLKIEERFALLTATRFCEVVVVQAAILLCAMNGLGVYSFGLSMLFVPIFKWGFYRSILGKKTPNKLTFRWARMLVVRTGYASLYAGISRFSYQLDYLIIGLLLLKEQLGIYFLAFTIAVQSFGLLISNLPTVSFPILSKDFASLSDLRDRFVSLVGFLAIVGAGVVSLQYLTLPLLIETFLEPKWQEVAPLAQLLTIAMFVRILGSQWPIYFKVLSDYKSLFWWSMLLLLGMVVCLTLGAQSWGLTGVAVGLFCYYMLPLLLELRLLSSQKFCRRHILTSLGCVVVCGGALLCFHLESDFFDMKEVAVCAAFIFLACITSGWFYLRQTSL